MPFKIPSQCPCCQTTLVRDGVRFYCPNATGCSDQIFARLKHAVSKGALDWDGMGDVQVRDFMAAGATKLSDLFVIDPEFLKTAAKKKFLAERDRVKTVPLWRKILALGVEGIGATSSKELADEFPDFALAFDSFEKLRTILGPVAAKSLIDFAAANVSEIDRLDQLGFKFEGAEKPSGVLTGLTFVITGALMSGTRPQVSAKIEAAGGKVKGSVSKGVNYLVVGADAGRGKSDAAEKLGTKCISEEDLYAMMGEAMSLAPTRGIPVEEQW